MHEASKREGTEEGGSAWHKEQVINYLNDRESTNEKKPFLIYLGFSHPHDTRNGTPELLKKYGAAAEKGRESFLDAMLADAHFVPAPLDASVRTVVRKNMAENFDKGSGFDPTLPIPVEPPLIERLATLDTPVLLLIGELDHPEVRRRNAYLKKELPQAQEKEVAQGGHNVPLENPSAFLAAITPFLLTIAK